MSDDRPLKSAYELAMERLRSQDRERGIEKSKPLTREQKDKIARLRQEAKAKLAELEIMHEKKLAETGGDPDRILELKEHFEVDRRRIESSLESKITGIKKRGD